MPIINRIINFLSGIGRWFLQPNTIFSNIANLLAIITALCIPSIIKIGIQVLSPSLAVFCPPETNINECTVFGNYSARNCTVALYVHPKDCTYAYWLQNFPTITVDNVFYGKVELGNPYGRGHVMEPPLDYEIFCVLVKRKNVNNLPGYKKSDKLIKNPVKPFHEYLKDFKVKKIKICTIRRNPESCVYQPEIISPKQPADPKANDTVNSPVIFEWSPNIPMYIELRDRYTKPVENISHKEWPNDEMYNLAPGLYELIIKETKDSRCESSVWFYVVQGTPGQTSKQGSRPN